MSEQPKTGSATFIKLKGGRCGEPFWGATWQKSDIDQGQGNGLLGRNLTSDHDKEVSPGRDLTLAKDKEVRIWF